ncbi:hypothetical protein [Kitasatospora sp. NPDC059571]|uniref:hypothetical protein n=1 Tax=Kitasatospora sp. NPDC059571 TaxID=3346871 RepID=UPI003683FB52
MASRDVQVWSGVVAVAAALAVVAGYLLGGPRAVWTVSAAETLLVMGHVARRFRAKAHMRTAGEGPDADHCDRCRRARERLDARA